MNFRTSFPPPPPPAVPLLMASEDVFRLVLRNSSCVGCGAGVTTAEDEEDDSALSVDEVLETLFLLDRLLALLLLLPVVLASL